MAQNIGTGLQSFGNQLFGFGLQMLSADIEAGKKRKLQAAAKEFADELDKQIKAGMITPEQAEDAMATAMITANDAADRAIDSSVKMEHPSEVSETGGMAAISGEQPKPPTPGVSQVLQPGKPLETAPTETGGVLAPFTKELGAIQEARGTESVKAAAERFIELGGTQAELNKIIEQRRADVGTRAGLALKEASTAQTFEINKLKQANEKIKQYINLGELKRRTRKDERDAAIKEANTALRGLALKLKNSVDEFRKNAISSATLSSRIKNISQSVKILKPMLDFFYTKTDRQGGFLGFGGEDVTSFEAGGQELSDALNTFMTDLSEASNVLGGSAGSVNISADRKVGSDIANEVDKILNSISGGKKKTNIGNKKSTKKTSKTRPPLTNFAR